MPLWRSEMDDELKECVREFFEKYLHKREESDSGRMFAPIYVSCCRSLMVQPLGELLTKMRILSGAEPEPKEHVENLGALDQYDDPIWQGKQL